MIRHDEHGFLAKPQPLGFHLCRDHLEGLARADFVRKEGVAAVEDVRNRVFLVFAQRDLRVHTGKADVAAVILAWTKRIEFFVVLLHQRLPSGRVLPNPILKSILDGLLLLLCKRRFLLVQHALFYAVFIGRVVDTHIAQIQRVFQNPVRIGTFRAVGHVGVDILH